MRQNTLDQIRQAVEIVTRKDLSGFGADDALDLDSINRIALLVEIENRFRLEMDTADVLPESFATLASLTSLLESLGE